MSFRETSHFAHRAKEMPGSGGHRSGKGIRKVRRQVRDANGHIWVKEFARDEQCRLCGTSKTFGCGASLKCDMGMPLVSDNH